MTYSRPCSADDLAPILRHTVTDRTFLRLHPATALWWRQRPKCRACAHYIADVQHDRSNSGERCSASRVRINAGRRSRTITMHCIDARIDGAPCGPAAALFEPKKVTI